jgi:hypothetical protein
MSALSKVEMSVSAPFWEFGGCHFDGLGVDEQRELNRLDVLARLDSDRLTARAICRDGHKQSSPQKPAIQSGMNKSFISRSRK